MKRVGKPVFFIVALLILALAATSVFGIHVQNGDNTVTYIKGMGDIRWGIDINGGVEATFVPDTDEEVTQDDLESAKAIIETRLTSQHITDYELYTDPANNRIIVRFPWKSDETSFDPEAAIQEISATAELTFRPGAEYETTEVDENGETLYKTPTGDTAETVLMSGSDVESATAQIYQDQTTGSTQYVVALELTEDGAEKFAAATEEYLNKTISIWMDDVMISAPTVESVITEGSASITGVTAEEATKLARQINAGALPFQLTTKNFRTISPTLGASSLDAMMIAGVIAFILIALFMILVFRLTGFVAVISLIGQIALCFAAVSGYFPAFNSFTLTLPGIAGIILSIGMGVDANIITATRIKEELWAGRTLDGAIQKGDDNSFWAIFDGNITTIIVSLILMAVFGPTNILSMLFGASTTGSIYSFGYTLLIGNIGNFIFGVGTTRLMTKSLSGFKPLRKKWLFGGAAELKSLISSSTKTVRFILQLPRVFWRLELYSILSSGQPSTFSLRAAPCLITLIPAKSAQAMWKTSWKRLPVRMWMSASIPAWWIPTAKQATVCRSPLPVRIPLRWSSRTRLPRLSRNCILTAVLLWKRLRLWIAPSVRLSLPNA